MLSNFCLQCLEPRTNKKDTLNLQRAPHQLYCRNLIIDRYLATNKLDRRSSTQALNPLEWAIQYCTHRSQLASWDLLIYGRLESFDKQCELKFHWAVRLWNQRFLFDFLNCPRPFQVRLTFVIWIGDNRV